MKDKAKSLSQRFDDLEARVDALENVQAKFVESQSQEIVRLLRRIQDLEQLNLPKLEQQGDG